jgi:uncharacterized membrane protein YbhN (UPF0104 family)
VLNRLRSSPWLRAGLVVVVVACAGYALAARWEEAEGALRSLPLWVVPASLGAAMVGLCGQLMAWRALLADLGSPMPPGQAARIMFPAQLAKYVPGSVWAFAAQVELAKERTVPRPRGAAATILAIATTLTVNLAVAALTLPFVSPEAARQWWWALAAAPVLLALLHPAVVTRAVRRLQRFAHRVSAATDDELDHVSTRGMAAAVAWSALAWIPLGAHLWVLIHGVAGLGPEAMAVAAGTYALAWTLGLLAVIMPAGIGVREVVLVVGLAPVLDTGAALVVAVLSRLVMTAADLAWGGLVLALPCQRRVQ